MHDNVKNGLKTFKEYETSTKSVWLPQFKIGGTEMRQETQIKNYRVADGENPLYVLEYWELASLQMYAAPISEGNLTFEVDTAKGDILVSEPEFFIAITH